MIPAMRSLIVAAMLCACASDPVSEPDSGPPTSAEQLADLICEYSDECGIGLDDAACVDAVGHCGAPALSIVIDECFADPIDCASVSACLAGFNCGI